MSTKPSIGTYRTYFQFYCTFDRWRQITFVDHKCVYVSDNVIITSAVA